MKTLEEIKDNSTKKLEVFVDGKRVNQADFLSEIPTAVEETEKSIKVFFETE